MPGKPWAPPSEWRGKAHFNVTPYDASASGKSFFTGHAVRLLSLYEEYERNSIYYERCQAADEEDAEDEKEEEEGKTDDNGKKGKRGTGMLQKRKTKKKKKRAQVMYPDVRVATGDATPSLVEDLAAWGGSLGRGEMHHSREIFLSRKSENVLKKPP